LTLTAKDVAEIMRILEQSSFEELSLEMDGVKLKLQRGSAVRQVSDTPPSPLEPPNSPPQPMPKPPSEPGLLDITAPLLGIFYVCLLYTSRSSARVPSVGDKARHRRPRPSRGSAT